MQYLTLWDLVLTPVYLLVLTFIAKKMRDKRYPRGHALRKYYLPGLYVKFGGVIFIALVYQFYYGSGDTFNFYEHSKIINSSLNDSVITWLKLIFRTDYNNDPELYSYISKLYWYNDAPSYSVSVIAAILGLFNGTTYLPIALLFAFLSYSGIWAMFRTFANVYPALHKPLAFAFLFIPSTFVWGSAIFKDTVCMFGLGWMTYCTFRIFIHKDFSFKNIYMLVISFYLVALIKLYILLAFLPALSLWLLMNYSSKIKSIALKWFLNFAFVAVTIGGFFFITDRFAKELNRYSLENIAATAEATRGWIAYVSEREEGSSYSLGEFDPSIGGMITKFPQAVVVTFFRPFPWEVSKVIVLLSALEALVFVFLTVWAFKRNGLFKSFRLIGKDPNLLFFLIFSLIFAFAVGISSYNFGALSRYKIPCLPFFAALLVILYNYKNLNAKKTAPIKSIKRAQPV